MTSRIQLRPQPLAGFIASRKEHPGQNACAHRSRHGEGEAAVRHAQDGLHLQPRRAKRRRPQVRALRRRPDEGLGRRGRPAPQVLRLRQGGGGVQRRLRLLHREGAHRLHGLRPLQGAEHVPARLEGDGGLSPHTHPSPHTMPHTHPSPSRRLRRRSRT